MLKMSGWRIRRRLVVIIYPLYKGILLAFTNKFLTSREYEYIGITNFIEMFSDPKFWMATKNSFIWVIIGVSAQLLLGFIIAYLLNKNIRFEKFFRGIFLIPWAMSTIATSIIFIWLYNPMYGHLNYYLKILGLEKIYFLADPKLALFFVTVPLIWRGFPFVMLVFLAALQSLDKELFEAAEIDGANGWQKLKYITLPLIKPVTKVITILLVIWTFNTFDFVWIITKGGPASRTHLLSTLSYYNAFGKFNVGYASAIGVIIFIILIIVSIIYIKTIDTGD